MPMPASSTHSVKAKKPFGDQNFMDSNKSNRALLIAEINSMRKDQSSSSDEGGKDDDYRVSTKNNNRMSMPVPNTHSVHAKKPYVNQQSMDSKESNVASLIAQMKSSGKDGPSLSDEGGKTNDHRMSMPESNTHSVNAKKPYADRNFTDSSISSRASRNAQINSTRKDGPSLFDGGGKNNDYRVSTKNINRMSMPESSTLFVKAKKPFIVSPVSNRPSLTSQVNSMRIEGTSSSDEGDKDDDYSVSAKVLKWESTYMNGNAKMLTNGGVGGSSSLPRRLTKNLNGASAVATSTPTTRLRLKLLLENGSPAMLDQVTSFREDLDKVDLDREDLDREDLGSDEEEEVLINGSMAPHEATTFARSTEGRPVPMMPGLSSISDQQYENDSVRGVKSFERGRGSDNTWYSPDEDSLRGRNSLSTDDSIEIVDGRTVFDGSSSSDQDRATTDYYPGAIPFANGNLPYLRDEDSVATSFGSESLTNFMERDSVATSFEAERLADFMEKDSVTTSFGTGSLVNMRGSDHKMDRVSLHAQSSLDLNQSYPTALLLTRTSHSQSMQDFIGAFAEEDRREETEQRSFIGAFAGKPEAQMPLNVTTKSNSKKYMGDDLLLTDRARKRMGAIPKRPPGGSPLLGGGSGSSSNIPRARVGLHQAEQW